MGALVAFIILGLISPSPKAAAFEAKLNLKPTIQLGTIPGTKDVKVTYESCWEANAYYSNGEVTICHEYVDAYLDWDEKKAPGAVRMTILHEYGHAAVDAGLIITGNPELAADEFATVLSLTAGRHEDVEAKAAWFRHLATGGAQVDNGLGIHPTHLRRAAHMECLLDKARGKFNWVCGTDSWAEIQARYAKLLQLTGRKNLVE